MDQLTVHQRERKHAFKAFRAAIRLKHQLAADDEIYVRLPELERKWDNALASGAPLSLSAAELFASGTGAEDEIATRVIDLSDGED